MLGSSSKGAVKRGKNLDSFEDDAGNKPAIKLSSDPRFASVVNKVRNVYWTNNELVR